MAVEKIKRTISDNRLLKFLMMAVLMVPVILYFSAFFTTGVEFDDAFLKKEVVSADSHYMGKNMYGNIHITVKGIENKHRSAEVVYRLPNNINRHYTVNFKDASDWDAGLENIKDGDGNIVFEGEYRKDRSFLVDKNGEYLAEYNIRIHSYGSPYDEDYKVPLKNVADFACFAKDTIRGNFELLVLAVFLFILTFIDIKYPLFFFTLKYSISVENPEPSEAYLALQKIARYAYPIIGIILMIAAIN